jgi:AcrR family transcriptional regulator
MTESYHHGNLRAELITEGLRLLCRDGIAAFSMRRLAQELGVSHAAAYRHFTSKEDLLRAILEEASAKFRDALLGAVTPGVTGEEALYRLGVGYVRFFVANPEIFALFSMLPVEGGLLETIMSGFATPRAPVPECAPHRDCTNIDQQPLDSGFQLFKRLALVMREVPEYRDLTERELLLGFWGKVHGIAAILITQKNFIPTDQLDQAIERVVRTAF